MLKRVFLTLVFALGLTKVAHARCPALEAGDRLLFGFRGEAGRADTLVDILEGVNTPARKKRALQNIRLSDLDSFIMRDQLGRPYHVLIHDFEVTLTDAFGRSTELPWGSFHALHEILHSSDVPNRPLSSNEFIRMSLSDVPTRGSPLQIGLGLAKIALYPAILPFTWSATVAHWVGRRGLTRFYEWPRHLYEKEPWAINVNVAGVMLCGVSGPLLLLVGLNHLVTQGVDPNNTLPAMQTLVDKNPPTGRALFLNLHTHESGFFTRGRERAKELEKFADVTYRTAESREDLLAVLDDLQKDRDAGAPRFDTLYLYSHGNVGKLQLGPSELVNEEFLQTRHFDLLTPNARIILLACLAGCDDTPDESEATHAFHRDLGHFFSKETVDVIASNRAVVERLTPTEYDAPHMIEAPPPVGPLTLQTILSNVTEHLGRIQNEGEILYRNLFFTRSTRVPALPASTRGH